MDHSPDPLRKEFALVVHDQLRHCRDALGGPPFGPRVLTRQDAARVAWSRRPSAIEGAHCNRQLRYQLALEQLVGNRGGDFLQESLPQLCVLAQHTRNSLDYDFSFAGLRFSSLSRDLLTRGIFVFLYDLFGDFVHYRVIRLRAYTANATAEKRRSQQNRRPLWHFQTPSLISPWKG
jgi:hypothetical protein